MIQIDTFAENTNENCKPAFWSSAEVTIRGEDMSARVFAVVHVQLISSYFRCILAGVGECGSFWHDKTIVECSFRSFSGLCVQIGQCPLV